MRASPTLGSLCRRVGRLACPACGAGKLFRNYFVRTDHCDHCGWRFEREHGHWVGGSEVHMFVSYGVSVLACIPFVAMFGATTPVVAAVMAVHVAVSLTVFRYSRAIFLGVDYYLDPTGPGRDDGGEHSREPARPKPPTHGLRRVPARRRSSRARTSRLRV